MIEQTYFTVGLLCGIGGMFVLALLAINAAYRNGVTDGYGYAVEPTCPGYKAAGEYLRQHMAHRWPELKDYNSVPLKPAFKTAVTYRDGGKLKPERYDENTP